MQPMELNHCENTLSRCRRLLNLTREAQERWNSLSQQAQNQALQAIESRDEHLLVHALQLPCQGRGDQAPSGVDEHIEQLVREGLAQSQALIAHLKTEPVDPARPAIAAAREFLEAETGHHRDINAILAISTCKAKLAVLGVAADQAYDHGSIIL